MFSKFLTSVLIFNRSENKALNFILIYLLISLAWHNQIFITFVVSHGGFAERLNAALYQSDKLSDHFYLLKVIITALFI
jgi:hypothetical protein